MSPVTAIPTTVLSLLRDPLFELEIRLKNLLSQVNALSRYVKNESELFQETFKKFYQRVCACKEINDEQLTKFEAEAAEMFRTAAKARTHVVNFFKIKCIFTHNNTLSDFHFAHHNLISTLKRMKYQCLVPVKNEVFLIFDNLISRFIFEDINDNALIGLCGPRNYTLYRNEKDFSNLCYKMQNAAIPVVVLRKNSTEIFYFNPKIVKNMKEEVKVGIQLEEEKEEKEKKEKAVTCS